MSFIKKNKVIISFILVYIISFVITFYSKLNSDYMWNFGFSYNTANGLMMYKDFNMVISPIYPAVTGLLMKIIGNNMLAFNLINAFYITMVVYIIYKIDKDIYLISFPLVIISCLANYNTFCILACLLLIYLEKEKKNDYLIGFIIGLSFLTKINAGLFMVLPTLYYIKDIKKCFKRFIGFMIPNTIVILFFLLFNNLKNYINYVFLGIFDFAGNNLMFSYMDIAIPIILAVLIILLVKRKEMYYLYAITFLGIVYPVMNELHVFIAITPAVVLIIMNAKEYIIDFRYCFYFFITFPLIGLYLDNKNYKYLNDDNIFKYRNIQERYIINRNTLTDYFDNNFDNVYLLLYDNYLYKYLLDLPINKYDLILYGNMGYDGTNKMINNIKNSKAKYYVIDNMIGSQYNMEIIRYIQTNYNLNHIVGEFSIYEKK